jgi:hypothetical protein
MEDITWSVDHDPGGKVRITVPADVVSTAIYSPCRQYRYVLHRRWTDEPDKSLMFIMANPSTATEDVDDPTVRKCRVYATRWGYNHLIVGNVMGFRVTVPALLRGIDDPVGPDNLHHLRELIIEYRPTVVCAWGAIPARLQDVDRPVIDLLRELEVTPLVLRLNSSGSPSHPLYLPLNLTPQVWNLTAVQ